MFITGMVGQSATLTSEMSERKTQYPKQHFNICGYAAPKLDMEVQKRSKISNNIIYKTK